MKIKVFIPSYKRLDSLSLVLYSLIKTNRYYGNNIEMICYIVNNFPDNKSHVNQIIDDINSYQADWKIIAIHREQTIFPVKSWYSAIVDNSLDGDIVFLHGDDDLFLPESISYRVKTIINDCADLLLTKHVDGILFYDNTKEISINNFKINDKSSDLKQIFWSDDKWSAIFIGNNTYRMSPLLREAFNKAMEWSDELYWMTYDQRTLMYPLYIPIALMLLNGKVIRSNKQCVIRGVNFDECHRALWGVPGWNSGFIHLAFIGILNNSDLNTIKDLDNDRKIANDFVCLWYLTFYLDSRILKETRTISFKLIGKPRFTAELLIKSLLFVLKGYLFRYKIVNSIKTRLKGERKMIAGSVFIDQLYNKY